METRLRKDIEIEGNNMANDGQEFDWCYLKTTNVLRKLPHRSEGTPLRVYIFGYDRVLLRKDTVV